MATVTPNFNWPVPTSTDLVKDGATAIEALGDSIDASLVDLKGGTTGQVLSKNSNTDMDFVWVTDAAGDIQGVTVTSPLTGGGTSGTVTVGILSGTTSNLGAVQLSDSTSSTSTTLAATANAVKSAYDPAFTNNFYAGKNKFINGDFGIWQRSTSVTVTSDSQYCAPDRFSSVYSSGGATVTWSRQTFTPGAAPVAGYEGLYFSRLSATSGGAGTEMGCRQLVENVQTLAGQTATFSFWAKADSARTASIFVNQVFGSGGSTGVTVNNSTFSVTTSWTRFTVTLTVPSISGKTIGTNSFLQLLVYYTTGQATGTPQLDLWGWQLEAGSTATPFQTSTGTLAGELAACQRYYYRQGGAGNYQVTGLGVGVAGGVIQCKVVAPVTMRIVPTVLDYSTLSWLDQSNAAIAATGLQIVSNQSSNGTIYLTSSNSTGVQYRPYDLTTYNSTAAYLGLGAEL
jgi:hypothetical protein